MTPLYISILFIGILLIVNIVVTFKKKMSSDNELKFSFISVEKSIERVEGTIKSEFSTSRTEASQTGKSMREETGNQLTNFGNIFQKQLSSLSDMIEGKLTTFQTGFDTNSKDSRKELKDNLDNFKTELNNALKDFGERQRSNFGDLIKNQNDQNTSNSEKLTLMNTTIEKSIKSLQEDNAAKLEKMRETVDEKLQKTLETRLGESFKLVSERLEAVHKGLGDMQQLATGVGDLKRVLTNVKTRGVLGEYQLENILEQLLTPDQYSKNVKTKPSSGGLVEFAVKLPGKENKENILWLPIDSKFPKEDFEILMNAYDQGTPELIEECRKVFIKGIKKCAGDICSKYIDPPNTSDFAILFLPFESLYAEVLRTPGLFETIQRECKIIITGPTTLSAILSSLQMGFRTLAIEKRSSEVWHLLAAVKTEFGTFGGILEKTHKKLQEASNSIEQASVRTRSIERKLKDVQQLPQQEITGLIDTAIDVIIENPMHPESDTERQLE